MMVVSVLNGVSTVDIIFLLMTMLADVFFIEYSTTLFVLKTSFPSWRWVVVSFVLILIVAFCASFALRDRRFLQKTSCLIDSGYL